MERNDNPLEQQHDQSEPTVGMKPMFGAEMERVVSERASTRPFDVLLLPYTQLKKTAHNVRMLLETVKDKKWFDDELKWQQYKGRARTKAMNAMIRDSAWSQKLAARHELEKWEVKRYWSELQHMQVMLNVDCDPEFRTHMLVEALERYKLEKDKADHYRKGAKGLLNDPEGLLQQLMDMVQFKKDNPLPPRLLIQEELYPLGGGEGTIKWCQYQLRNLKSNYLESDNPTITKYRYEKETKELKTKINKLIERKAFLESVIFWDKDSNENFNYINAIGLYVVRNPDRFSTIASLNVSSLTHGRWLLTKYAAWYNEKYAAEIEQYRAEKDRLRKARGRAINKLNKQERDEQIIAFYLQGVTNAAEIARRTEVPARTVRKVLERYHNQSPPTDQPTAEEIAQAEQERLEEEQAREWRREEECRRLEQKAVRSHKDQLEAFIIVCHKKGYSPTRIRNDLENKYDLTMFRLSSGEWKNYRMTPTSVKKIIEKHGFEPNFDLKTATPEEQEQERVRRQKLDQEYRKKNPRPPLDI